ncbi:hypothetical protein ACLBXM_06500 [Xanthobacteraceae bacterium A53D]
MDLTACGANVRSLTASAVDHQIGHDGHDHDDHQDVLDLHRIAKQPSVPDHVSLRVADDYRRSDIQTIAIIAVTQIKPIAL